MSDPVILRFGMFELDGPAGELRKNGDRIKLPPQPFRVLELLVQRGGGVVTRADIRAQIWCDDTFVDFDQGLNFCIRQIREALGDTAVAPRFIETLPRRGYRFLAPLESAQIAVSKPPARLIVLPFRMLRPDPENDHLAFSLPDALTTSLSELKSLVVRSSLAASRFAGGAHDLKTIAADAEVDMIVTGTLLSAGAEIRVTAQLTDAVSGTLLWSYATQAGMGDVFRVQDELAERVVESLSLPLSAREEKIWRHDVPSHPKAYEYFLRANQFSRDPQQWNAARELYLKCLEADPEFAPAWARLGRTLHVMAKYLGASGKDEFDRAEAAFKKALDLNAELGAAHKAYAQLEVDRGRARDAMVRLLSRARGSSDSEMFAGLVSPLRYCGLLGASAAAHAQAVALDPRVRTSVPHTWFLQADYRRLISVDVDMFPYIVALALAHVGRGDEAVRTLGLLEEKTKTRLRDFMAAARTMIEGDTSASLAAVQRIVSSGFGDPEALFYLTRHLARLGQVESAVQVFSRVVEGGFFCYPAMAADPWLDALRPDSRFQTLLVNAEGMHRDAQAAFEVAEGDRVFDAMSSRRLGAAKTSA
jgi:TolB-like protein